MGVIASGDRQGFSPGQQLVRTDKAFSFLLMLLREIPHTLGQLVWVSQKKSEVEGTGHIQDLDRLFQIRSFAGIGSPTSTIGEVKEQLRGAACLSHWLALPVHVRFRMVPTRLHTHLWLNGHPAKRLLKK